MYIISKFIQFIKDRIKKSDVGSSAGFSMIELLVALSLSVMTATGLTLTMTQGVKNIRAIQRANRLNANAEFIASTFTYWIKQSIQTNASGSTLTFITSDLSEKTIGQNGTTAITLGDNINPLVNPAITSNDIIINNLAFTDLEKSVRVSYTLQAKNAKEALSITTTIAQRSP